MAFIYLGGGKNPVAWCALHKRTLSVKQMRKKKCLEKQCTWLAKKDHPYWAQREQKKQLAKARREAKKNGKVPGKD